MLIREIRDEALSDVSRFELQCSGATSPDTVMELAGVALLQFFLLELYVERPELLLAHRLKVLNQAADMRIGRCSEKLIRQPGL